MVGSLFVSDAELTEYINKSIGELHDLLVSCYGEDYFSTSVQFTSTGASSYTLTASPVSITNFYKLRGLDIQDGGRWTSLKPFMFNERNRAREYVGLTLSERHRYRLMGGAVVFETNNPPPTGSVLRLWYVPLPATLTNDSDTFDGVNSWEEYVVVDAAIKMLRKEESDTSLLLRQKAELKLRIEQMAPNRDAGEPQRVTDVNAIDDSEVFW